MKTLTLTAFAVAALVLSPASASAAPACDPAPAWTETVSAAYDETVEVTPAYDETVVVTPAYDETVAEAYVQRYSWTGGPHVATDPPAFPSADWQANVKGDPHNVGQPGAYYRSHGNSGNGDWFYLDYVDAVIVHHDEVVEVVNHPAVTDVIHHPAVTIDHPEVVCDLVDTPQPPADDPAEPLVANEPPTDFSPVSAAPAPADAVLPSTGGPDMGWLGIGALLVVIGVGLLRLMGRKP